MPCFHCDSTAKTIFHYNRLKKQANLRNVLGVLPKRVRGGEAGQVGQFLHKLATAARFVGAVLVLPRR